MSDADRARFNAQPVPTKVLAALIALLVGTCRDVRTGQILILPGTVHGVLNMLD